MRAANPEHQSAARGLESQELTQSDATEESTQGGTATRRQGIAFSDEFDRLCDRLGVTSGVAATQIDGRYRVEQSLGQGAMGVVFRAWDDRLGRRVAVKLVHAQGRGDIELMQTRLEREAQMLARVDHRNVVGIHDVGSFEGRVYLAMQYVAGVTMRAWLKAQRRSPREIIEAYLQAARGLAAAHAVGIVHRDFKPDNVIVGDDGIVRVLDFGIASALISPDAEAIVESEAAITFDDGAALDNTVRSLTHLTRTGAIMGTLPYMAPEQLRASGIGERSDQFAFCVALWEALAGKRPYDVRTPAQYYLATETRRIEPADLPHWIRPILTKGLSHEAADRYAGMNELIAALEHGVQRRQRFARIGVATIGLPPALLAGWLLAPTRAPVDERETCAEFAAQVDEVWGDAQRAELQRFAPLDESAVGYARTALDALGEGWGARARTVCSDELAPTRDDPTRACMETWLTSFEHAVALLTEHGDLQTLVRAPDLLVGLSSSGDFCERAPSHPIDPEVTRLVRSAREAATIGDPEQAAEFATQALRRANEQVDGRAYTPELAEAHAARAEVAMRASDFPTAEAEFALAEQQAIGVSHWSVLLPTYTLWAKVVVVSGTDATGALAGGHIDRALPFADSLELPDEDLRRVDLIEGRGLALRAASRQTEAIEQHRRARERFEAANQPVLAAKSLNNIGANYQELDDLEQAKTAYREAADLLARAGVSERHQTLLDVEFNLGQLAMVEGDAAGLPHLQRVARLHPNPVHRLRAGVMAGVLAYKSDQLELAVELAEATLAELAARSDVPAELVAEVELAAGISLASKGDPRGEPLVHSAERRADELSVHAQLRTRQSWILWLEQQGRCADAQARIEILDTAMANRDDLEDTDYSQWRANQTESTCPPRSGE